MKLIGVMNGRNCIKRVVEIFYATMPESGQVATYNVPYIRVIKTTLEQLTGQTFITGEANKPQVQEALKKYVEWYNANWEKLVKQIGEPDLDITDPEYTSKLRDARKLKLTKTDWPRGDVGLPTDLVGGPNTQGPPKDKPEVLKGFAEREVDKKFGDAVPTLTRDQSFARDPIKDPVPPTPNKADALKRDVDKTNDAAGNTSNSTRDAGLAPPTPEKTGVPKAADPFKRPQDLVRDQNNQ
jgi:hypothetical protein